MRPRVGRQRARTQAAAGSVRARPTARGPGRPVCRDPRTRPASASCDDDPPSISISPAEEDRHVDLGLAHQRLERLPQPMSASRHSSSPTLVATSACVARSNASTYRFIPPAAARRRCTAALRPSPSRPRFDCAIRGCAPSGSVGRRFGRVPVPVRIEVVDPAVRTVVDRQAQDRHVVGVHHAVDEADAHPAGNHARGSFCRPVRPLLAHRGRGWLGPAGEQLRKSRRIVKSISASSRVPSPRDAGSSQSPNLTTTARRDRRLFPVPPPGCLVEHAAHHRLAGCNQAERPCRRHAEVVHRLAAEELVDRVAHDRATVSAAGEGRRPGALELQLPALAGAVDDPPSVMARPSPSWPAQ